MNITVIASSSVGNCYRVNDGITTLLIECGIPINKIKEALDYSLSDVDGCLISHEHMDHAKAAKDLLKAGVDIYASGGTIEALELKGHRVNQTKAKIGYTIGSFVITPFDVRHDAKEPLGFQITSMETGKKLVFITDTFYVKYKFRDMNYLMIECNYDQDVLDKRVKEGTLDSSLRNRIRKSHMSLQQVKEMLKNNDLSKLKTVYLMHLSDGNSDEKKMKKEVQELTGVPVVVC